MKYVLGVLGFIILAVIAVVLLATTTGNRSDGVQEGTKIVNLADYISGGEVSYTVAGKIVGEEEFKSVRITVSPSERKIQVLSGYSDKVEKEQVYANTGDAFDAFMRSLSNAGYTRERSVKNKDMRGTCPLGRRYTYKLQQGSDKVVDLWSTSCSAKEGTFGGNRTVIRQLFQNQVPEYNKFIRGYRI
jgi:hypothetical protein